MRAHQIENGIVINTIEVESLSFMAGLVEATEGGIGWTYADGVFTAPLESEIIAAPTPTKEELLAQVNALSEQIQALA